MDKENMRKRLKIGAVLLASIMSLGIFHQTAVPVQAADAAAPSVEQFATKAELLTEFDTDNDTEQSTKTVYFGKNWNNEDLKMYIVGKDTAAGNENGLVLFASSALAINTVFDVNSNKYGESSVREWLQQAAKDKQFFSLSEQELIMDTSIATKRNATEKYTTVDKLYLGYKPDSSSVRYFLVGSNTEDDLESGLKVDVSYVSSRAWMRTPASNFSYNLYIDCLWSETGIFNGEGCLTKRAVVPAVQIDTSTIAFASTIPAVTSAGEVSEDSDAAFTLRTDAGNTIGTANVLKPGMGYVNVEDAAEGTYLVVQNANGAFAKAVTGDVLVSASEIIINGTALTSFENCKIWLEKAGTDNIPQASLAGETEGCAVQITAGSNMTKTSSSGRHLRL